MIAQVSVKQIVRDFIYIGNQLHELFKDKKEYLPIVQFLTAEDYLNEDLDIPFPKMKDVQEATGLKSHILRKILLNMHSEIFTYERKLNISFKKVLYHFYITYFDHSCQFTVDYLTHLPRVGDSISVPFVSAVIPINFFYVDDIKHEFENNTQIIIITLKVGQYSKYFEFMQDRALQLKEISFTDTYQLREDELKKIIYKRSNYR